MNVRDTFETVVIAYGGISFIEMSRSHRKIMKRAINYSKNIKENIGIQSLTVKCERLVRNATCMSQELSLN